MRRSGSAHAASGERLLLGGFAPLAVAALLALLAIVLVPSVAPEQIVLERDAAEAPPLPTSATTSPTTTATTVTVEPAP